MSEVRVKENESLDSALRRFKRQCAKSGVMSEIRKREHYEKPSVKRKKKSEAARKRKFKQVTIMTLKERLADDLKSAMKNKDTVRKNVVQFVRAGVLQVEKDKKVTLDDNGVLEVIAKQLKQRKDSLPDYEKSGRDDLIAELKAEMDVLMEYLPKQLTKEELTDIIKSIIDKLGASSIKDMGKVMAEAKAETVGKADGRMINEIAKDLLS